MESEKSRVDFEQKSYPAFFTLQHEQLPMMPAVYEDVFRWHNGEAMQPSETPAGALAARLSSADSEIPAPRLTAPATNADAAADDSFYWFDHSANTVGKQTQQARVDELQRKLKNGQLPEFIKVGLTQLAEANKADSTNML